MAKKPIALRLFDLTVQRIGSFIRSLLIWHLDKIQLTVAAKALGVLCNSVIQVFLFNFSNCDNTNFQLHLKVQSYTVAYIWSYVSVRNMNMIRIYCIGSQCLSALQLNDQAQITCAGWKKVCNNLCLNEPWHNTNQTFKMFFDLCF